MEKIFVLMIVLGCLVFLMGGICSSVSIEAKESKLVEKIFTIISALGLISVIIGLIGSLIIINI